MAPSRLMVLGCYVGVCAAFCSFFAAPAPAMVILAFGGGMLFGKGYGIWEMRQPDPTPAPRLDPP